MKRPISLLLSAILIFGFTASGFRQKKTVKPPVQAKSEPIKQEITAEEEITLDKSYLVINDTKKVIN